MRPCKCGQIANKDELPDGFVCPCEALDEFEKSAANEVLTKNMRNDGKTFTLPDYVEQAKMAREKD